MKIYNNAINMKQAVAALLQTLPVQAKQKVKSVSLKDKWAGLMGEFIAGRTTTLYIKSGTLFLRFDTPALKQDLQYRKTEILQKVQGVEGSVKRIFWY